MTAVATRVVNAFAIWKPGIYQGNEGRYCEDPLSVIIRVGAVMAGVFTWCMNHVRHPLMTPLTVPLTVGASLLAMTIEKSRADYALNQIATNAYMNATDVVPDRVMFDLQNNITALKQLVKQPSVDLNKVSESGSCLIQGAFSSESGIKMLPIFQLLLDHGAKLKVNGTNYFFKFFESGVFNREEYILYALKNDKIKSDELTSKEIIQCWEGVQNYRVAQQLLQKGFDIEAKDQNGMTVLERTVLRNDLSKVCFLLKLGAKVPDLDRKVVDDYVRETTLRERVKDNPQILMALAGGARDASAEPCVDVEDLYRNYSFSKFNAYVRPVLPAIIILNCALFALDVFAKLSHTSASLTILSIAAVTWLIGKHEVSRSTKILDELAEKEFKNKLPAAGVSKHIIRNERLFDRISKEDVFKLDDQGNTLWSLVCERQPISDDCDPAIRFSIFKKIG